MIMLEEEQMNKTVNLDAMILREDFKIENGFPGLIALSN